MLNQSCSFVLSNKLPMCAVFYELNSFGRDSVTLSSFVDEKWLDQMPSKYYEQLKVKSLLEQVITTFTISNIGPSLCYQIMGRNGVGLKELEENLRCLIKLLPKENKLVISTTMMNKDCKQKLENHIETLKCRLFNEIVK